MCRQSPVAALRACVLAHRLADLWRCPHTGQGLAVAGTARYLARHKLLDPKGAPNDKWRKLLQGRPLRDWAMLELQAIEPELYGTIHDRLWLVLHDLWDLRHPTNVLALAMYDEYSGGQPKRCETVMHRICGCPDWRSLGAVLAILGADANVLTAPRVWLQQHFFTYFLLMCMMEPACFVRKDLYDLLDGLVGRSMLAAIDGWPPDLLAFVKACQEMENFGIWLQSRGHSRGWDLYTATLIQMLWPLKAQRDLALHVPGNDSAMILVDSHKRRVAEAVKQHKAHVRCFR